MPPGHEFAIPLGADPRELADELMRAHEQFLDSGIVPDSIRPAVAESWRRSASSGSDLEYRLAKVPLSSDDLRTIRATHPLASVMPTIRRLLIDSATQAGLLVAVSDAAGHLLWVEGAKNTRDRAERMNFVPGSDWVESSAGTNAPAMALVLDRAVQLLGPEHLARAVTPWSCTAAPIHDPDTGAILGALDVTGGPDGAAAQTMGLVKATAAAVEAQLRVERLQAVLSPPGVARVRAGVPPEPVPRLETLGQRTAILRTGESTHRLGQRHSEIILLLGERDSGWTAAELAIALSEVDHSEVTIRAEVSRLRQTIAPLKVASRPYRLCADVITDVAELRAELERGSLRNAVSMYRGPLLPDSRAPGIEEIRDQLHGLIRSQLLVSSDTDAILAFADAPHGRDDYELWRRLGELLPVGSPRYAQVVEHVAQLDQDLR